MTLVCENPTRSGSLTIVLKLVDALTLQSIGRDAVDACQSKRCSMTIATHDDFDYVHEMASVTLAMNPKKEWALYLLQ